MTEPDKTTETISAWTPIARASASLITFPSVPRRHWVWRHMRFEVWLGYSWIALGADGQPRASGWVWEKPSLEAMGVKEPA